MTLQAAPTHDTIICAAYAGGQAARPANASPSAWQKDSSSLSSWLHFERVCFSLRCHFGLFSYGSLLVRALPFSIWYSSLFFFAFLAFYCLPPFLCPLAKRFGCNHDFSADFECNFYTLTTGRKVKEVFWLQVCICHRQQIACMLEVILDFYTLKVESRSI